jgi:hypothetical protein
MSAVNQLPAVGRIQGISVLPDTDPKKAVVDLQYTDIKGAWHGVKMSLLDALYLLNLLEGMSKENNFDHLRRDPRRN